jgi:hypothetical protein
MIEALALSNLIREGRMFSFLQYGLLHTLSRSLSSFPMHQLLKRLAQFWTEQGHPRLMSFVATAGFA